MNDSFPLISFLINCYNSEKFLSKCIESALKQSYKNFEIIIWDNCSTDNTSIICKKFNDNRIKYYFSNTHMNLVESRIKAWEKINGKFVAIMDSDDISHKDRLKVQLNEIQKNKNIAVVGGAVEFIDNLGKTISYKKFPITEKKILSKIQYIFPMNNSTLFFDKKKIDDVGGYTNKYEFINDFELVYRVSKKYNLINSNIIVSKNRIHDLNLSKTNFLLMQNELLKFLNHTNKDIKSLIIRLFNFFERLKCKIRIIRYKL